MIAFQNGLDSKNIKQGGHSSWKSLKCPGILFCPENALEDDPFSAEGPGKVLENSNKRFKSHKLKDIFLEGNISYEFTVAPSR